MNIINPYRFADLGSVPEPVHWYDLDNLTTGIQDQTAVTATAVDLSAGAAVSITTDGFAPGHDCVSLDGTSTSFLQSSQTAWQSGWGNKMSAGCWAYMDSVSSIANFMLDWATSGSQNMQIAFINAATDFMQNAVIGTGGFVAADANADSQPSTGAWFHTAFTWDGSTFRSFLNGVKVQEKSSSVPTAISTSSRFIWLGMYSNSASSTYKHVGDLAMVGIWSEDIGVDGVNHLYNSGNGRLYNELNIV